jgi:hypothetical protein
MTLAVNIAQGGSNNVTFRNRIINGACVIDQRNAGASVSTSTTGQFVYTLDRWNYYVTVASKFTLQQNAGSVTPPAGFSNYLGITSSSAYSVGSGDLFLLDQKIEGFNTADLAWGTANAKTVTLSFQVYSSLTGTFGGSILNGNQSRSYPFTYTVSTANTWTQVSITVAGETTGTWLTTNGIGIYLFFGIGVGSTYSGTAGSWSSSTYYSATGGTSVVGTNGATWYVTGVQLEAGTTASPFEYRQYTTELQLCQRYYETSFPIGTAPGTATPNGEGMFWYGYGANSSGSSTNTIECWANNVFKVQKRTTVTVITYDVAGNSGQATRFYTGVSPAGNVANTVNTQTQIGWKNNVAAGSAANGFLISWTASAEL